MKHYFGTGAIVALTTISLTGTALAQSSSVTAPKATSTATASSVAPAEKKLPIGVSTQSMLYGTRLNDPFNELTTDSDYNSDGSVASPIKSEHLVKFKYSLAKSLDLTPTLNFYIQHTDGAANKEKVNQFQWRDCFVKLSRDGILERKIGRHTLALDGDLRYYAPTSNLSRRNNSMGSARISMNPSLRFANSKFSLAFSNNFRYWFQTRDIDIASKTNDPSALIRSELYVAQQINYQATPKLNLFVLYENALDTDKLGAQNIDRPTSAADLEPGLEFQVSPRVMISPWLNWYTSQSIDTTTFNLTANITLL